jgi:hypothetical protein
MPYRRLPNTDVARLRALKLAYVKGKELPPFKLAFSSASYTKLLGFLPQFEHSLIVHKSAYNSQVSKSKDYTNTLKKAKLYISHFIQVINMAILRGDIPASILTFYGLQDYENKVPQLNTEAEVLSWGDKLINGESERIRKGMSPISNPSIALVKVRFENFKDAYNYQKTLQKDNNRTLQSLAKMRSDGDVLIAKIWDEVEASYRELPDDIRREKSKEYGLTYVFRKNELKRLSVLESPFEETDI